MKEMEEIQFQSLGQEDSLEYEMAFHSSRPAWKIPWAEEPGGLQFMGPQRVGHQQGSRTCLGSRSSQNALTGLTVLIRLPLLEKAMATHSSILAWKIPWTEEPGRLQSMGSLGVGHG